MNRGVPPPSGAHLPSVRGVYQCPQLPEGRTPFLRQQHSATYDHRLWISSQFCHFLAVVSDSLHKRSGPQFPHVQNTHNLFPRGPEKRPHMLLSPSEITMQLPTFDHFLQKWEVYMIHLNFLLLYIFVFIFSLPITEGKLLYSTLFLMSKQQLDMVCDQQIFAEWVNGMLNECLEHSKYSILMLCNWQSRTIEWITRHYWLKWKLMSRYQIFYTLQ